MSLLDEAESIGNADELREANRRLQVQLAKAKAKTEDLVAAVYQATRDSLLTAAIAGLSRRWPPTSSGNLHWLQPTWKPGVASRHRPIAP